MSDELDLPVPIGEVLAGKYRVERVLGRGGMGIVVAAHHLDLDERVAIKFLLPQALESKLRLARFLQEARAAAKIRSEHVARVYDVGQLDNGAPYLVMEYLDGDDVGYVVKRDGPLALADAAEYLLMACEALAAAHARGIVHRDIKPSNLFLSARADKSRIVKVIDFGISKVPRTFDRTQSEPDPGMTQSHALIGSPHFMAPEQMRSAKHVDARADVWSLGASLYTMLTGDTPFHGDSVMGIYDSMLKGAPALRSSSPEIPEAIDTLVARCLSIDPERRPADVAELAEALAPFAPARAQHLIERIRGTLAARPRAAATASETNPTEPTVEAGPALASPPASEPAVGAGTFTQQAWSDARAPGSPGRRRALFLGVPVAVAIVAMGIWWRGGSEPVATPSAAPVVSAVAREAAPAPVPLADGAPGPHPRLPDPPLRASESKAVASVAPSATPSASASAAPSAKPAPRRAPKDLWGDPF